jgi:thiol:disulfide interchange protein DsbC
MKKGVMVMKRYSAYVVVLLLLLVPLSSQAFPPKQEGGKDCIDCHQLDKKEAETLVRKMVPTVNVTDIKVSPLKTMWQIDVENNGQRGVVFLDFSKKYVIGQVVPVESIGKVPPARKVDFSKIPLKDAIVLGKKKAKKKVIVFTDPDCPYCRQLHDIMKQIVAKRDDIAFALIMNPLPMHKEAPKKAQAILCSKSIEILNDAFAGKPVPEPTCPADAVQRSIELAKSLEFAGTPTLVREDGTVLSGFLPEEKLLEWIDKKQ